MNQQHCERSSSCARTNLERARDLHGELRQLVRRGRRDLAAIAHRLADMQTERLYRCLGFSSVYDYALHEHEMGRSMVTQLIGVSRGSQHLPDVRRAFDSGELPWTKAREVVKVATPATQEECLAKAKTATGDELRLARMGQEPRRRRVLSLSAEEAALYDQLVAAAKEVFRVRTNGEAILEALERAFGQESCERSRCTPGVGECPDGERAELSLPKARVGDLHATARRAPSSGAKPEVREGAARVIPLAVRGATASGAIKSSLPECSAKALLEHQLGPSLNERLRDRTQHDPALHDGRVPASGEAAAETPAVEVAPETPFDCAGVSAERGLRLLGLAPARARALVEATARARVCPWNAGDLLIAAMRAG